MAKNEIPPRLTIVTGDDSFAMELSRDKYLERVKSARGGCAIEMFDSASESIDDFLTRAATVSLFQEVRVFVILHAQELSADDLGTLGRALEHEIPDVYMFVSAEIEKKAGGFKAGKKAAGAKAGKKKSGGGDGPASIQDIIKKLAGDGSVSIIDCPKPPDYKLAEWIMDQVPQLYNRHIAKPCADYLAEIVEYDLIYSELQKIDLALPPGARIDRKTIQDISGVTRTMTVYELASALGKKDLPSALNVLDSLFTGTFYAPLAVSAVFKHFWAMLKIKKFLEKNPGVLRQYNTKGYGKDSPQTAAAFEIGLAGGLLRENGRGMVYPVIIKSGIVGQSQSFGERALKDILKALQKFDVDVKTGRAEASQCNLQMLCYRIVRA
jgi:DNA polymerase III delta subunit